MATSASPEPGRLVAGRYLLQRVAWTSPLGDVWSARDRVLDRPVAVQTLAPLIARAQEARHAFRRAAARAAQLSHPGLLQIYDIGTDPEFVVLEAAPGGRLADRMDAGPLDVSEAARIALAVARALEALHEDGGWHGALSPATVALDVEGRPKVLGAGLAEVPAPVGHARPPGYLPREREPSPDVADRFALAALTYQMVTGRAPDRMTAPARSLRRRLPAALDALLTRSLSADPAERPRLDSFMASLAPFARAEAPRAREPLLARTSEFRWLAPVAFILALAAVAIVLGTKIPADLGRSRPPRSHAPSAAPLAVASVADFDPPPGNGEENPRIAADAADGNPLTSWKTVGYRSADLGGGKHGVGLVFDLGAPRALARIRVRSTLPGWAAEWRAADSDGTRVADYRLIGSFTASEDTIVPLPRAPRGRYFLLWITRLAQDDSQSEFPWRAFVSEVEFFGAGG
ncbi:MAG: protein kinase [Acidobacteria bacterium]|nr:protein kinase [Acidobacteriota bacterium]